MSQLLSNTNNNENIIDNNEDLSDYDDVELPKMQRMNALIILEQKDDIKIQKIVPKKNNKIYFSKNCPICLEEKKLIPLECGHTFCFEDIQELIIQARKTNRNILCSICRTVQNPLIYCEKYLLNSLSTVR